MSVAEQAISAAFEAARPRPARLRAAASIDAARTNVPDWPAPRHTHRPARTLYLFQGPRAAAPAFLKHQGFYSSSLRRIAAVRII